MKPREKKPEIVFRIIDRKTGHHVGSYSRACCDEYDFESPEQARSANCHDMFKDMDKYKIAKYRVTYKLIEDDVDGSPHPVAEDTGDILTVDKLKAMSPRIIFATGVIEEPRLYRSAIRWVAVRGKGMPDWAIYYQAPTQSVEQIRDRGDKCFTEAVIKDLVKCDRDAFKMYRY